MNAERANRKFRSRAFVALAIGFSLAGLAVTGIANHFSGFEPLTTARHAWMSAHNILAFLFCGFALWHVALNRQWFWQHLARGGLRLAGISLELILAVGMVTLAVGLFVAHTFHAAH